MTHNSILISAGEASGEAYGAQLMDALRRAAPERGFRFFGLGGDKMGAAGCELTLESREVAVVGLTEVVRHLPRIYARFQRLLAEAKRRKPAAAVLIDFPDFNLRLARELDKAGIPVFYYVSPQLWAWRPGRVKTIQRHVRRMLVIFPFEQAFYAEHGVEAEYVGHPLADAPLPATTRAEYAAQHGLDASKTWVALLPGSRSQEVTRHLDTMLDAAERLGAGFEFLLPVASTLEPDWISKKVALWRKKARSAVQPVLVREASAALALARASVVASGTATVEAALAGQPFVVVYRVAPGTWKLGRRLVRLENFAMVNLIAGKTIVPELIQDEMTAEAIVKRLRPLLEETDTRKTMMRELASVREALKPGKSPACDRAAAAILRSLGPE